MFKWVPYPFLRLSTVLIAGILWAYFSSWKMPVYFLLIFGILYIILAFAIPKKKRFQWSSLTGLLGMLWLLTTSIFYTQFRQQDTNAHHLKNWHEPYSHYVATAVTAAEPKTNSFKTLMRIHYLLQEDSIPGSRKIPISANVLIYQPKSDSLSLLKYGDKVLIKGKPQAIKPPANPHEFDFKKYLAQQHIYHQHYLPAGQWLKVEDGKGSPVLAFAYTVREHCRQVFEKHIYDRQARGIALALVLGIKNELDDEIRDAYAAAGAMHVLAVSGLHVGIIYLVLSFLLSPLERVSPWGKVLKAIICLLTLWSYALLTGLSPSVMRAATMFSFIIVAEASRRQTNIYNTIAASAFFLLLYDPLLILSVGFQLSYLAVLGIVYLQPKIYQWLTPESKYIDWLWSLTSVSLAAQLATFPLGLYYFHQFPLYFWLSNILVIPAAYVILSLGLLCFMVSWLMPAVLVHLAYILEQSITFVNSGVLAIEGLPFSVLDQLYFSSKQTLLMYAAILCLLMLFYYRRFKYVSLCSLCILFICGIHIVHIHEQQQKNSITIYQISKKSSVELSAGRNTFYLGEPDSKTMYHLAANQLFKGGVTTFLDEKLGQEQLALRSWKHMKLMVWNGKKIAMITEPPAAKFSGEEKITVDILLICNNAISSLHEVEQYFDFEYLVVDSSNSYYKSARLADEAKDLNISYHCVPLEGAFEYTFD